MSTQKEIYDKHNRRVHAASVVKGSTKVKVLASAAKIYAGLKVDGV